MKSVFKMLAVIGCAAIVFTGIVTVDHLITGDNAKAQNSFPTPAQSQGGIQNYVGAFFGYYQTTVSNGFGGLIWTNVPIPAFIYQNAAPAYDLTNTATATNTPGVGGNVAIPVWGAPPGNATVFTNPPFQTTLVMNYQQTNNAYGVVSNETTHMVYLFGSTTLGTNDYVLSLPLGPGDLYVVQTNQPNVGNAGLSFPAFELRTP